MPPNNLHKYAVLLITKVCHLKKNITDHVYCQCVKDYDNLLSSQSSNPFILIDCSILTLGVNSVTVRGDSL